MSSKCSQQSRGRGLSTEYCHPLIKYKYNLHYSYLVDTLSQSQRLSCSRTTLAFGDDVMSLLTFLNRICRLYFQFRSFTSQPLLTYSFDSRSPTTNHLLPATVRADEVCVCVFCSALFLARHFSDKFFSRLEFGKSQVRQVFPEVSVSYVRFSFRECVLVCIALFLPHVSFLVILV